MDHSESFLFNAKKEAAFTRLCERIHAEDGILVFAGDIFDFTGMTPCREGHREFFQEAVGPAHSDSALVEKACRRRSTADLLRATGQAFPGFFASLRRLIEAGQLIYIPGNHDCDFLADEARAIFADVVGVDRSSVKWQRQFQFENHLIVAHGNEFDRANRTISNCRNPGFVFTSALYQGVLPALRMLGLSEEVLSAIPAVRPEEETVVGIQHYLGEETCRRILVALARLLQRNGYFRGVDALPAWFLSHEFPWVSRVMRKKLTPERIRSILPQEERLREEARKGAKRLRAESLRHNPQLGSAVIVLGHTHEMDTQSDYVNLGTWIDHITGLTPAHIAAAELSLPVFRVDEAGVAQLLDIKALAKPDQTWADCTELWRR